MMIHIRKWTYELEIDAAEIRVVLDGCTVAALDVRTAVPQTAADGRRMEDNEPELPIFTQKDENTFVWTGKSSLWTKKTYMLTCTPLRFLYDVTVEGRGSVDGVEYFSGNGRGSRYEFQEGMNPCVSWYKEEDYRFKASQPCHRWSVLMVPPMFCYSFRTEGLSRELAFGLAAKPGEHNFHAFDYHPVSGEGYRSGFYLSTDQDGHTKVDGSWTAPHILGYGAENAEEAFRGYADYYYSSGLAQTKKAETPPRFWYGPMACGWIEQYARHYETGIRPQDMATQELYEEYVRRLHAAGLDPKVLIIDDKWQSHYATDTADPEKWPDMRGFVEKRRKEGIHTLLWFRLFDEDGFDVPEALLPNGNYGKAPDPSHPAFLKVLDEALERILSDAEGCYDCDGIKIDYAYRIPRGREVNTFSGKYGVELLYDLMEHIYTTAKRIKPEVIINCSPCHPYFAHLCDQARLHDYDGVNRNCAEDLEMRAKMYRIAMPNTLIDCDNAGFHTRRDTMRWMLRQPHTGVPDLYCLSPLPDFAFETQDLEAMAAVWQEYTARVDAMYSDSESGR